MIPNGTAAEGNQGKARGVARAKVVAAIGPHLVLTISSMFGDTQLPPVEVYCATPGGGWTAGMSVLVAFIGGNKNDPVVIGVLST